MTHTPTDIRFPDKHDWPGGEPMLAVNIDDIECLTFPLMGQPKLNGIRACWDGEYLISRQRKVWRPQTLPHIYDKLRTFSRYNPGVHLDGELYCHGASFQGIAAITSINRNFAHAESARIEYHAFDIIGKADTESRQLTLCQIYKPWVAVCRVASLKEVDIWTNRFVEAGFEGLMLRSYSCPYLHGRTEGLIKVKPWKHSLGVIVGFTEGKGKYQGILGALTIRLPSDKTVNVSGGLSDTQRYTIWKNKPAYSLLGVTIKYRELSRAGIPLQPQLVKI